MNGRADLDLFTPEPTMRFLGKMMLALACSFGGGFILAHLLSDEPARMTPPPASAQEREGVCIPAPQYPGVGVA